MKKELLIQVGGFLLFWYVHSPKVFYWVERLDSNLNFVRAELLRPLDTKLRLVIGTLQCDYLARLKLCAQTSAASAVFADIKRVHKLKLGADMVAPAHPNPERQYTFRSPTWTFFEHLAANLRPGGAHGQITDVIRRVLPQPKNYMVSVSDILQPYHKQWWVDRIAI